MTKFSAAISNDQSIHAALELSKNSWLLAIQVPGRDNPSLHPIKGGDADGLMAKLDAARRATRLGRSAQVGDDVRWAGTQTYTAGWGRHLLW